ncbi:hypothetical protein GO685_04240 [Wolbachia endosymbiont of Madathamugadia hiepei]|uniref:hypothetical protein n=1 Tax=Wolbachia endosymbiont of Madathamugadia hiepei TaxID=1241303 RepID=UPI00158BD859|nr:hypothetical protein [Wolbachia endosymbiont of Madathamugadia hiepei]NUX01677.1 hypothetical protein [Wolbachia endosymbiont of Madathamugadia hiepei]
MGSSSGGFLCLLDIYFFTTPASLIAIPTPIAATIGNNSAITPIDANYGLERE